MIKKAYILPLFFVIYFITVASGQNIRRFQNMDQSLSLKENYELGNKLFAQEKYYAAIDFYQKVLEEDISHAGAHYHLGSSYSKLRDYRKAGSHFEKLIQQDIKGYPLLHFQHGMVAKANGDPEEAIKALEHFIRQNPTGNKEKVRVAQRELESCRMGQETIKNAGYVEVNLLDPSDQSSVNKFAVAKLPGNAIVYTSVMRMKSSARLDVGETHAQYDELFVNRLFVATLGQKDISNSRLLKVKPASDHANIGSPFVTEDGNRLYFTLCNDNKPCNIYFSTRQSKDNWSKPVKLDKNVNAPGSDSRHPTVGKDRFGTEYIFFSSDRRGGEGDSDIWYARLDKNGNPSGAVNLGASINTRGKEVTPFFDSQSNLLFFSSDGHKGLGELDVYMVTLDLISQKGEIYNLGFPINSVVDDYYFSLTDNGRNGFLSSNRSGSAPANQHTTKDNIYHLTFNEPFTYRNLPDYISKAGSFDEDDVAFRFFSEAFDYKALAIRGEHLSKRDAEDIISINGSMLQDGEAKGNAWVYLVDEGGYIVDSTRTDAEGGFRFRRLPGGQSYSVMLDGEDDVTMSLSFEDESGQELLSVNSEEDDQYFHFGREGFDYRTLSAREDRGKKWEADDVSINGSMLQDGQAKGNAWVYLVDEGGYIVDSTRTDAEGGFRFRRLPGGQSYSVMLDGEDDVTMSLSFEDESGKELLSVNSEEDDGYFHFGREGFDYRTLSAWEDRGKKWEADDVSINGSMLQDGQAKGNAWVYLVDEGGYIVDSTRTDAAGGFRFRHLSGSQNYSVMLDGGDDVTMSLSFEDESGQELLSVNSEEDDQYFHFGREGFDYRTLSARGDRSKKFEADDISINGSMLQDGEAKGNAWVYLVDEGGYIVDSTLTDAGGGFRFRHLSGGQNYSVMLDGGDDVTMSLSFEDESGQELLSVNSEEDDQYFHFGREGFDYRALSAREDRGKKWEVDDISINGSMLQDGQAKGNAWVYLVDEGGYIVDSTRTDSAGGFRFRHLSGSQNYSVMLDGGGDVTMSLSFEDESGQELLSVNSEEDDQYFHFGREGFDYRTLSARENRGKKWATADIAINGSIFHNDEAIGSEMIYLVDESGRVVDSTLTDATGHFRFRHLSGSQDYSILMKGGGDVALNVSFFDDTGQELRSVNSLEDREYFYLREALGQGGPLPKQNDLAIFHLPVENPLDRLRKLFEPTLTYDEYKALVQAHGATITDYTNLRVQIGAYRNPKKELFEELRLGEIDRVDSGELTRFLIGNFNGLEEAELMRRVAYGNGIRDAFVSVYYGKTRLAILLYSNNEKLFRTIIENDY